ncbi:MAG: hypothetical protein ACE5JL_03690, partial [Dehalococcoidia bacterium]
METFIKISSAIILVTFLAIVFPIIFMLFIISIIFMMLFIGDFTLLVLLAWGLPGDLGLNPWSP